MLKIIKRIIEWTGTHKKRLYKGFVYSMLNSIFVAMPIMIGAITLNLIIDAEKGQLVLRKESVYVALLSLLFAVFGRYWTSYKKAVLQESIGYEVTEEYRTKIGNLLKRVSLGFFQNYSAGDITAAVTSDLSYMEMYAMKMIDTVVNGYIGALTLVICMLLYKPILGLVCLGGLMGSAIALKALGKKSQKNAPLHQKAQKEMIGSTIEYIKGLSIVKSFGHEGEALQKIKDSYQSSKDVNIGIEKQFVPMNCMHLFSLKIASVFLVTISSFYALNGDIRISELVMIMTFSFMIFAQVEGINNATHVLEMLDSTMNQLERIANASYIDSGGGDIELKKFDIDFENVSFSYETKEVIRDVSFHINQGTTTAIVGPSGGGKSTLCNLIARFYDPQKGDIKIGGTNLKKLTCESLLKNISMVFQKVYLFNDSIYNNIAFGNTDVTREEVIDAAKKACCHDFIMKLPNGYETIVEEGGASLSGGEKQRISIARAILKKAPIVILDEATASVDPENEHQIQKAISALTHGKTIIVIAHRLATIENADQILVVNQGQIVQNGTHKKLSKEKGIYKQFMDIREKAESWRFTA
jgi:ATP-binding cassette subfamily B protein